MVEHLQFPNSDVTLAGTLTLPDGPGPHPAVVTAPGFAGVKEMLIPTYAASLANAGIGCLAFDYAGFGESGGEPRQHVDPRRQRQSFISSLDALGRDPRVDPTRLGVWGTSLSGGHALHVAATDRRIRAAVALIPFIAFRSMPDPRLAGRILSDLGRRTLGGAPGMVPVAGEPGDVAAMTSDGALDWIAAMAAEAANYRNSVTLASLLAMARTSNASAARRVRVPLRVILAEDDAITPASQVRRALRGVPDVDIVAFANTHFELFDDHLAETVRLTTDWFVRHLAAA